MIEKSSERILFLTIWLLLFLGFAIWRFWPREEPVVIVHPEVILRQELISWFESAAVVETTPTQFTVDLRIQPQYIKQLPANEKRKVLLGFHFMNETNVLSQGIVEALLSSEGALAVVLPNPNRVAAKTIQLSLAQ